MCQKATKGKGEGRESQVSLGLASAGRDPEEVADQTLWRLDTPQCRDVDQLEDQLERAPRIDPAPCPLRLQGDCSVSEAKSKPDIVIAAHQIDSLAQPPQNTPAFLKMARGGHLVLRRELSQALLLRRDPCVIGVSERGECGAHLIRVPELAELLRVEDGWTMHLARIEPGRLHEVTRHELGSRIRR
jgi:hypothetical protein